MSGDAGTCMRCRWYEPDPDLDGASGWCHRMPPAVFWVDEDGAAVSAFASTEWMAWCGEFEEDGR